MRFYSTFVVLGLAIAGALAYPASDSGNSLYARSADAEDLALRDLYEAYLNEMAARDYDDALDLEARHDHHVSVTVHLRADEFDELDARDYDDDLEELAARYDEFLQERDFEDEDFEAREDYEELDAREPFHPRIGIVIPSSD
ncbi:hypothetical protein CPB84DRAFT_1963767 [Gymnopilus junonius]|uniref:Uncharacterized protein n=1 Tax=Gymnopilus junonius TaxID=109634 RepID=A0A9P5NIU4_GYMJU|nr:hypothetical protein CPB84DRAFT_1963767 [Gymnopilus junonius]